VRDTAPQRFLWRLLEHAARVTGVRPPRVVAAAAMRLAARTERGYRKGLYRVASRRPEPMPDLWAVPQGWWLATPRVRVRRLGLRLDLDLRDNLQRTVYFTGTYEPGLLALLERELRAGDVVLDVGAHVGVHALGAARRLRELGGGRVIAFEPTPDSAAALADHVALNGVIDAVETVSAAVSDCVGAGTLYADGRSGENTLNANYFGDGDRCERIQVPITTIDTYCRTQGVRPDVIKIDVEGFEFHALRGAADTLGRLRPPVVVEFHAPSWPAIDEDPGAAKAMIEHLSYRVLPLERQRDPFRQGGHVLLEPVP